MFGRVWASAEASGLRVLTARSAILSDEDAIWASECLALRDGGLKGGNKILVLQLMGEDSDSKLATLVGHLIEQGMPRGAVLTAPPGAPTKDITEGFFGPPASRRLSTKCFSSAPSNSTTCFLVLPHAVLSGHAGAILSDFSYSLDSAAAAGAPPLEVTSCRLLDLSRGQTEEFLEVYKGVVPEYSVSCVTSSFSPLLLLTLTHPLYHTLCVGLGHGK